MEGVIDGDAVALLDQLAGHSEARRTGADDRHLLAGGGIDGGQLGGAQHGVRREALQAADGDRLALDADDALDLALLLLGADAPADGAEGGALLDDAGSALGVVPDDLHEEGRDVNAHGAAVDAGGVLAHDAAGGFELGLLGGEPQAHLVEVAHPQLGRLAGHLLAGDLHLLAGLDGLEGEVLPVQVGDGLIEVLGVVHGARGGHAADLAVLGAAGVLLLGLVPVLPHAQHVEVHLVAVEVGAVEAGELDLATHAHATAAAHAGAVHHDGVEAHQGEDVVGLGQVGDGAHHGQGAHGDHLGDGLPGDDVLEGVGDQALAAQAAVVCGDDELGGGGTQLIGQEDALSAAATQDGDDPAALGVELLGSGQDGGGTVATGHQNDGAFLHELGGGAHGASHGEEAVARAQLAHGLGGGAHFLHDEVDVALPGVAAGQGEGDALALGEGGHHEELAGLAAPGHLGGLHDEGPGLGGDQLLLEDQVAVLGLGVGAVEGAALEQGQHEVLFGLDVVLDQVHQALAQQGQRAGRTDLAIVDLGEQLQVQVPHLAVVFMEALVEGLGADLLQEGEELPLLSLVVGPEDLVDPAGPLVDPLPVRGRQGLSQARQAAQGLLVGRMPVGRGQITGTDRLNGRVGHGCLQIRSAWDIWPPISLSKNLSGSGCDPCHMAQERPRCGPIG